MRVDQLLVARGLAPSRSRAQAMVLGGEVFAGDRRLDRPGMSVDPGLPLERRQRTRDWVSRGALKLIAALDRFPIDPHGVTALDIGASTGGFTEVLLARGAAKVFAVDVGHDQLHAGLRHDPRVLALEGTNARHLDATLVPEPPSLIVCDASFISLRQVLPAALALADQDAALVALIKPQFEVGRAAIGKNGVVRDADRQAQLCDAIARWLELEQGWQPLGVEPSPITGAKGNREFLIAARRSAPA